MTIYILAVLSFQLWTSLLFYVWFQLLLLDLHAGFSRRQVRWSGTPTSLRIFQFVVICGLVPVIYFEKYLAIIFPTISSVPFSLLEFPEYVCYIFHNFPIVLEYCSTFFFLFHLFISFWEVSINISSRWLIFFLSCVLSAADHIKGIIHFFVVFLILNIFFLNFSWVFISLLTLPICSYMLYTFSIKDLNIFCIFILNSKSDNFQIAFIWELVLIHALCLQIVLLF